jgi:hypothetical protein
MRSALRRGLFFSFLLALTLPLASCDSGGSSQDEELSPDEAETQIRSSIDGLSESLETLEGGGFSSSLKNFLGLQSGDATSEDWAERLVEKLDTVFESSENPDRFRFDASTGEYAWNADTGQWTEQGSSSSVILRFPASEEATSNNATLELSQYSDTELTIDGEAVYLPTSGTGSISVEGSEVFSVDLSGVDYTTEEGLEVPIPQSFSLEILTAPHTHAFDLIENSSTDYDFSFDLTNGDQPVVGVSVGAQLATNNYDELEGTDVEELSGELRIGPDLAIPYTIQVAELAAFDDPTEEQINNRIDATVEYRGQQIATLRYDEATEQIEVVYSDGSVDPASDFYENFLDEMETIWSDYLGDEGLDGIDIDAAGSTIVEPLLP